MGTLRLAGAGPPDFEGRIQRHWRVPRRPWLRRIRRPVSGLPGAPAGQTMASRFARAAAFDGGRSGV